MKDFSKYKLAEEHFFSRVRDKLNRDDVHEISFLINDFFHFCRKYKGENSLFGNEPIYDRLRAYLKNKKTSPTEVINTLREAAIQVIDEEFGDELDRHLEINMEYVLWRDSLSDEDRKKHKLENMTEEDKKRMSYHMVGKEPSAKQISFLRSLGVTEVPKDMAHASRLIDERLKKGVARSNTPFLQSQSWGGK